MSIERGNFRNRLWTGGAAIACAASLAGAYPRSTAAEAQGPQGVTDCLRAYPLLSEQQRACNSYVNDAVGSLWGLYSAGNSIIDGVARHHFETRFFPPARGEVEQKVTSWPEGFNDVDHQVDFVKMNFNGTAGRAFVETRESWSVRHDGRQLMPPSETKPHLAWHTLCYARQRILPSIDKLKPYKEWLVTDNFRNLKRNCAVFAGKLATGQIR